MTTDEGHGSDPEPTLKPPRGPDVATGGSRASNGAQTEAVERIRPVRPMGPPREVRSWALNGLFVLGGFYTLYLAKELLLPIVLASLLALLLAPVVSGIGRLRTPRWMSAGLLVLALVAALGAGLWRLAGPAGEWIRTLPQDLEQVERRFQSLMEPMEDVEDAAKRVESITQSPDGEGQAVRVEQSSLRDQIFSSIRGALAGTTVMFVLLFFLLASGDLFIRKLIRVMPTFADKKLALTVARQVQLDISRHLLTITVINATLGVTVGVAMSALGMPNPVLWGVMAAFFNYVPYLGAMTGVVVLALASLGHFDEGSRIILVPGVYLALTAVEGSIITPMILGQRLRLNPVAIFVGLLFWGWLWGVAGALLAVPILVVFKIVCDHYEPLSPVAEFLGR